MRSFPGSASSESGAKSSSATRPAPWLVRETKILGVLEFRPSTGRLVVFDKFRGAGDCGIYSVFQLQKTRFTPRAVRAKVDCNCKGPLNPLRWPLLPKPQRP